MWNIFGFMRIKEESYWAKKCLRWCERREFLSMLLYDMKKYIYLDRNSTRNWNWSIFSSMNNFPVGTIFFTCGTFAEVALAFLDAAAPPNKASKSNAFRSYAWYRKRLSLELLAQLFGLPAALKRLFNFLVSIVLSEFLSLQKDNGI